MALLLNNFFSFRVFFVEVVFELLFFEYPFSNILFRSFVFKDPFSDLLVRWPFPFSTAPSFPMAPGLIFSRGAVQRPTSILVYAEKSQPFLQKIPVTSSSSVLAQTRFLEKRFSPVFSSVFVGKHARENFSAV